jgi:hypothetical protein
MRRDAVSSLLQRRDIKLIVTDLLIASCMSASERFSGDLET